MTSALQNTSLSTSAAHCTIEQPKPPSFDEALGVWNTINRKQAWQKIEICKTGLVRVFLETQQSVEGTIQFIEKEKCVILLNINSHKPMQLIGSWCLWHGVLDFCFLGEYMAFTQRSQMVQLSILLD
jgi:hypothetical protein